MSLGVNEILLLTILVAIPGILLYLLPSIIAFKRKKNSAWAIFVVNLIFGWTFIGWIGALIWSLTGDRQMNQNIYINQSVPHQDQIDRAHGGTKLCPTCAETIKKEAIKCRYCGEILQKEIAL